MVQQHLSYIDEASRNYLVPVDLENFEKDSFLYPSNDGDSPKTVSEGEGSSWYLPSSWSKSFENENSNQQKDPASVDRAMILDDFLSSTIVTTNNHQQHNFLLTLETF